MVCVCSRCRIQWFDIKYEQSINHAILAYNSDEGVHEMRDELSIDQSYSG